VLYDAQVDAQYLSLKCDVNFVDPSSPTYEEIASYVEQRQVRGKSIRVRNVYTLQRPGEWDAFAGHLDDQRLMFHGSRIQNWVGILSRGILLPKIVVNLGVHRTDAGWLGHGIYFGDASSTSCGYTSPGRNGTRFMAVARVALGRVKQYTKITYGLTAPPEGYDSCHGVRAAAGTRSAFYDDEFVVYDGRQQRLEYLVEFTA
jgi:poly [ADP-ribose] polymerase